MGSRARTEPPGSGGSMGMANDSKTHNTRPRKPFIKSELVTSSSSQSSVRSKQSARDPLIPIPLKDEDSDTADKLKEREESERKKEESDRKRELYLKWLDHEWGGRQEWARPPYIVHAEETGTNVLAALKSITILAGIMDVPYSRIFASDGHIAKAVGLKTPKSKRDRTRNLLSQSNIVAAQTEWMAEAGITGNVTENLLTNHKWKKEVQKRKAKREAEQMKRQKENESRHGDIFEVSDEPEEDHEKPKEDEDEDIQELSDDEEPNGVHGHEDDELPTLSALLTASGAAKRPRESSSTSPLANKMSQPKDGSSPVLNNEDLESIRESDRWLTGAVIDYILDDIIKSASDTTIGHTSSLWLVIPDEDEEGEPPNTLPRKLEHVKVMYIPVHTPGHWSLLVVRRLGAKGVDIALYDSLEGGIRHGAIKEACNVLFKTEQPITFKVATCPEQNDSSSCGLAVLSFTELLVKGKPLPTEMDFDVERDKWASLFNSFVPKDVDDTKRTLFSPGVKTELNQATVEGSLFSSISVKHSPEVTKTPASEEMDIDDIDAQLNAKKCELEKAQQKVDDLKVEWKDLKRKKKVQKAQKGAEEKRKKAEEAQKEADEAAERLRQVRESTIATEFDDDEL